MTKKEESKEEYKHKNTIEYLTRIFNKIELGEDPTWSEIYRIYKKGGKKRYSNYRGISVIQSIARLFSAILKEKIKKDMISLSEEQCCYKRGRSGSSL